MTTHLWGGRFRKPLDENFRRLNATLSVDRRLIGPDIQVSISYADCLCDVGVLTEEERDRIKNGLAKIRNSTNEQSGIIDQAILEGVEDIHSFVELELFKLVGDSALKLNTGRSRNDQVVTDLRIWTKEHIDYLLVALTDVQKAIVDAAEGNIDIIVPGYTHLQRAQPVMFAHHLLAYFEMFERDKSRLRDAKQRLNVMPLGAAALAGTNFNIDRESLARQLGFSTVTKNSMDSVSDRDFVIEVASAIGLISIHLSRLAEDFILFSTREFNFIELDDSVTTGSSLMPQKKNADSLEIIRGKTGRICGNVQALFMLMKALPMTYNKDMAEDKQLLFDSVDTITNCLKVMCKVMETFDVNISETETSIRDGDLMATEIADYLVRKKIPFRKAHHAVGQLILLAKKKGVDLTQLTLHDFQSIEEQFDNTVFSILNANAAIEAKNSVGGTSKLQVTTQLAHAKNCLMLSARVGL